MLRARSATRSSELVVDGALHEDPASRDAGLAGRRRRSRRRRPWRRWRRWRPSKTMFGDLPPSSSVDPMKRSAVAAAMREPVAVLPVNEIFARLGWSTRAWPASAPNPVTTLTAPGGKPASTASSASRSTVAEVYSDGLITTVLPTHSAGASLLVVSVSGEFHGVIAPTTPERLARRVVEHGAVGGGDDVAVDLVGQTGVVVVVLGQRGQLGAHLAQQLAVVLGLHPGELLGVLADEVAEPAQQVAAPRRAQVPPARVLERRARRVDRPADVGGVAARGLVQQARGWRGWCSRSTRRRSGATHSPPMKCCSFLRSDMGVLSDEGGEAVDELAGTFDGKHVARPGDDHRAAVREARRQAGASSRAWTRDPPRR